MIYTYTCAECGADKQTSDRPWDGRVCPPCGSSDDDED